MRANTSIDVKDRRQFVLSDLRGADFSSSPLQAASNRATDMTNFISEYGSNQKRHGWRQLLNFKDKNGEAVHINGVFPYRNGDETEILVYAGKRFYRVWKTDDSSDAEYTYSDVTESAEGYGQVPSFENWIDERCQCFCGKGVLYIVGCGEYLRWGYNELREGWILERLGDSAIKGALPNVYVPTTTVSIDTADVADTKRKSLDAVNLLTVWRKNTLVGCALGDAKYLEWQLDTDSISTEYGVSIEIESESGSTVRIRADGENLFDMDTGNTVGTVLYDSGRIRLNIGCVPPVSGRDNITVWFVALESLYRDQKVPRCRFGTLFGVGGAADRLFLAGCPEYPNVEFFSEVDDFTYFPDQYTATLGTDQNEITGFLRMSDNALAIFKRFDDKEASVYFQTGEYREYYEEDGDLDKIVPVFSLVAGATGESAVNAYTGVNFVGDNMILSQNGVYAIELTENVATNARTARERSRAINARLSRQEGLSEAVGIVWHGKYYLAVDGVCYVADSRYKYQPEDRTSYNYEWWFWDNIPARVWAVVDDSLWFGTGDGRICMFDDKYSDRSFVQTEAGDLGFDFVSGRMVYGLLGFSPQENDRIKIKTDGVFALYPIRIRSWNTNGVMYVSEDDIVNLFEGTEVYIDGVGTSGLSEGVPYYIAETDRADCTFQLADSYGTVVSLNGVTDGFRLLISLSNRDLYICNVDILSHTFGLKQVRDEKTPLTLVNYFVPAVNGWAEESIVPVNPIAEFWHCENVVARWYTPLFDFGTNESSKTLLKLTLSCMPQSNGKMNFGYETRKSDCEMVSRGLQSFSFDNLDFSSFSFETGFTNSYSVKVKERNFNFIIFRFISDSNTNCCINDFTVTYKINKRNLGVK